MDAIVLALLGGVFFGIMAVFLRIGLGRVVDPELGALHTQAVGFATALVVVAAVTRFGTLTWSGLWPFFALGLVVPGITQVMWTRAVGDIGASRAMVITGTIPLASSIAAIIFLSEPLRAPLALGTVLIVAGAVVLAWDRARPPNYRAIGVLWAAGSIGLFATRDTISRWVVVDREISGVGAAAALLAGASIAVFI
ncbi:MAG: EamA family transporter, partial [Gaiellales bacterium]